MYRITRHCWIDEVRARTRRAQTFAPEEAGHGVGVAGDAEIRAEMHDDYRAMGALTDETRVVHALVTVDAPSSTEAAGIPHITSGTPNPLLTPRRTALARRPWGD